MIPFPGHERPTSLMLNPVNLAVTAPDPRNPDLNRVVELRPALAHTPSTAPKRAPLESSPETGAVTESCHPDPQESRNFAP